MANLIKRLLVGDELDALAEQKTANAALYEELEQVIDLTESQRQHERLGQLRYLSPDGGEYAEIGESFGIDPQLLDLNRRLAQSTLLSGADGKLDFFRKLTVSRSRTATLRDPVTETIIRYWTDFGFGLKVDVVPRDPDAQPIWTAFFTSKSNRRVLGERFIRELSDDLLTDGEFFFVFFIDKQVGTTKVRVVNTDQITKIVSNPNDERQVWYYKRELVDPMSESLETKSIYYRDWLLEANDDDIADAKAFIIKSDSDAIFAEDENQHTEVMMMAVQHNPHEGRGFPLMTTGLDYSLTHKKMLEDQAAVSASRKAYTDSIQVDGGQRYVDMLKSRIASSRQTNSGSETNPAPPAGSADVMNRAVERKRLSLATSAQDAKTDSNSHLSMAGLAGGIFLHWLGSGESFRLATATAMEAPTLAAFNGYQNFWASVWRDMVDIVLTAHENYVNGSGVRGDGFKSHDADVNSDPVIRNEVSDITSGIETTLSAIEAGDLPPDSGKRAVWELEGRLLQALGVTDIADVLDQEELADFIADEPEPDEPPPEPDEDDTAVERLVERGVVYYAAEGMGNDGETYTALFTETEFQYRQALRRAARGLYSGDRTDSQFEQAMNAAINRYLNEGWQDGIREFDFTSSTMTDEMRTALDALKKSNRDAIGGLLDAIKKAARENKPLSGLFDRLDTWAKQIDTARIEGKLRGAKERDDPNMVWRLGPTEEHCGTCNALDGFVAPASVFLDNNLVARKPGDSRFECGRWKCLCDIFETSQKAVTRTIPI